MSSKSGDIKYLICNVTSTDSVLEGLCEIMGRIPSR